MTWFSNIDSYLWPEEALIVLAEVYLKTSAFWPQKNRGWKVLSPLMSLLFLLLEQDWPFSGSDFEGNVHITFGDFKKLGTFTLEFDMIDVHTFLIL